MEDNKKQFVLKHIFDTLIYTISYIFLAIAVFFIMKTIIEIAIEETIIRYYMCGILFIFAAGLSLANIESYNKKYNKNDSNSSKGQNDYFFESDILREEGRYTDRRNME